MIWFVFAFCTALFRSFTDVFSKKGLQKVDEYVVSWSLRFFGFLFLVPLLIFGIPSIGVNFFPSLVVAGILNAVSTVLYIKALKCSDLSLVVPMTAFTPLFLIFVSPFIVGEVPTTLGIGGVILIVVGSYVLNSEKKRGYLRPLKALIHERGVQFMLGVAFLWSLGSTLDKVGVLNSSPFFWALSLQAITTILLTPFFLSRTRQLRSYRSLVPIGLLSAVTVVFQYVAITMTLVTYVISIKRTSTIMSVIFGRAVFKEKAFQRRIIGAAIMIIGVIIIVLLG